MEIINWCDCNNNNCCNWKAKLLLDELTSKHEQNLSDLAKEKMEEESRLKEIEQEAAEVKKMKTKLAESLAEAKNLAGKEKVLRKKSKDQKMELANLQTDLIKMKTVMEGTIGDQAKLVEDEKSLAEALSKKQAEVEAVKSKKMNFGEELNQVTQAQLENLRQAVEKKAKLASEVEEIEKKVNEVDKEKERLTNELQVSEKMKMEKKQLLEERKKVLERDPTANSKSKTPVSTPAPSSKPKLLSSHIFNKPKDQQSVSRRPALKTDVEKVKLGSSRSNLTPNSTKSAPSGSVRKPFPSPRLKDFRESRTSFGEKDIAINSYTLESSSSDEKQTGGSKLPKPSRVTPRKVTPRKEKKKLGVPHTPTNTAKLQPMLESKARSGTYSCPRSNKTLLHCVPMGFYFRERVS